MNEVAKRVKDRRVLRIIRYNFEWDPTKASDNLDKHGVAFEEAARK